MNQYLTRHYKTVSDDLIEFEGPIIIASSYKNAKKICKTIPLYGIEVVGQMRFTMDWKQKKDFQETAPGRAL